MGTVGLVRKSVSQLALGLATLMTVLPTGGAGAAGTDAEEPPQPVAPRERRTALNGVPNDGAFVVSDYPSSKMLPDIWGPIIVWADHRSGDWDIYGFNLATNQEFPISTANGHQVSPSIQGNIVVWQDGRSGVWDIYGFNLTTSQEFPVAVGPGNQISPDVFGHMVVWEEAGDRWEDARVYGRDLGTQDEVQLSVNLDHEPSHEPSIFGHTVFWTELVWNALDGGYTQYAISALEIGAPGPIVIKTGESDEERFYPDVFGNIVVWEDGNGCIFGYDLATAQDLAIYNGDCSWAFRPSAGEGVVVWEAWDNGYNDVYIYYVRTGTREPIVTGDGGQGDAVVQGGTLVWIDSSGENDVLMGRSVPVPLYLPLLTRNR